MAGIELLSGAFYDHAVPARGYAYEGDSESPPSWSGIPDEATGLVPSCEDPDAPSGTFAHRAVVGIDPRNEGTEAGEAGMGPPAGTELVNGHGERGCGGPHPPQPGDEGHRYFLRLYALGEPCVLPEAPSADQVHQAVDDEQLASGTIVAVHRR
ncbi:YbhB/YbcL family Raf kinase inhibitor-like protein [Streptomyces phaeoluteigriseus]|uniref:YbhB/YbcL family Raf kinase inhibitor-like protein n=1 Tax=Streptomyces phaeoluteigriseus TaxID=114686 RepID=A0ABY4ZBK7_9ACTN|nr:YbhB/YbcL family Raf kinase inhibitor-like protein [Streptomyces phaeoluteigriseus]USQ86409.1 YbhB/YbcL family Raf kinase inhibitor-like protein [Streptomyces phaeoluteigriseus]